MSDVSMNLAQLQRTVSLAAFRQASLLQTTSALTMIHDFQKNQQAIQQMAPHPYAGKYIDIKI